MWFFNATVQSCDVTCCTVAVELLAAVCERRRRKSLANLETDFFFFFPRCQFKKNKTKQKHLCRFADLLSEWVDMLNACVHGRVPHCQQPTKAKVTATRRRVRLAG